MNRSVVRSALGRCRSEASRCSIPQYPTSTPRHFSTTDVCRADGEDKPFPPTPASRPRPSATGASQRSDIDSSSSSSPRPSHVDARSWAASPSAQGGDARPKIINLRSLPTRTPFARGGRGGAQDGTARRPRFSGAFQKFMDAGAGGGRGGGRGGARGQGFRGRGGGSGGRGGRGGRKADDRKRKEGRKKDDDDGERSFRLAWGEEEQAYLDRAEQGVPTAYAPSAAAADYAGYGPAVATDAPLGRVEAAVRSMRVLAGGRPFCAGGYYADDKATLRRYREEKRPVFFDDLAEREWLVKNTGFGLAEQGIQGPDEKTKAAIIQTAVRGEYKPPKFVELQNTMEVLANYHAKELTWKSTDGSTFDAKVGSLLPGGRKAAAPRPKA